MDPSSQPCYLNGEFMPLGQARIPVLDRGFIFGDGIYEVIPVYRRRAFRLEAHLDRLERSLRKVRIASPLDRAGWRALIARLVEQGEGADQSIYLQVTRGVARRDFSFPAGVSPTVFGLCSPLVRPGEAQRNHGLRAISLPDARWLHCDIKATSLLGAVLARQQATDAGVDEAIQHRDGWLTEGSSSNVWVVRGGRVGGPPRDHWILEGVRYEFVAELCAQGGIPFEERRIAFDELARADELLLTSALREVLAVVELDGRPVGDGRPGPVYRALRAGYDRAIAS